MRYPYCVFKMVVEDHEFWGAKIPALRGCVAQGETQEEAVAQLEVNEKEWLDAAKEYGLAIPEIPIEQEFVCSGKFTVRVAPYVHKKAVENAAAQGISLNQYVSDAIVAQNSSFAAVQQIMPCVRKAMDQVNLMLSDASSVTKGRTQNVVAFDEPLGGLWDSKWGQSSRTSTKKGETGKCFNSKT